MKFGVKCRFGDTEEMLKFKPEILEFHFSDKDLDEKIPSKKFDQELMVHAPEYLNYKLVDLGSLGETNQILSREQSVKVIKETIKKTLELSKNFKGKPSIVIHPGGYSMDSVKVEIVKKMIENLKKSVEELKNKEVDLYLENLPPFPWFFGGQYICNVFLDAKEIKEFCDTTGIQICFDTCHSKLYCNHTHKNLIDEIKILKPYIVHLHISDAEGTDGEGLQIEDGEINWNEIVPLLEGNASFVYEIWKGHEKKGEGFRIAIERMKKYL